MRCASVSKSDALPPVASYRITGGASERRSRPADTSSRYTSLAVSVSLETRVTSGPMSSEIAPSRNG